MIFKSEALLKFIVCTITSVPLSVRTILELRYTSTMYNVKSEASLLSSLKNVSMSLFSSDTRQGLMFVCQTDSEQMDVVILVFLIPNLHFEAKTINLVMENQLLLNFHWYIHVLTSFLKLRDINEYDNKQ